MKYTQHAAGKQFRLMTAEETASLDASLETHGFIVQFPCKAIGSEIVDGWNRWLRCTAKGIRAVVEQLPPDTDPWAYSRAANESRRHLTKTQRTALFLVSPEGEAVAAEAEAEAAERRVRKPGSVTAPTAVTTLRRNGTAAKAIADKLDVKPRLVEGVRSLQRKAPEEFARVVSGEVGLDAAERAYAERKRAETGAEKRSHRAMPQPEAPAKAARVRDDHMLALAESLGNQADFGHVLQRFRRFRDVSSESAVAQFFAAVDLLVSNSKKLKKEVHK